MQSTDEPLLKISYGAVVMWVFCARAVQQPDSKRQKKKAKKAKRFISAHTDAPCLTSAMVNLVPVASSLVLCFTRTGSAPSGPVGTAAVSGENSTPSALRALRSI